MRFVPHEYQRICLEHLRKTPKAALFLDCGMGKTVITETYIQELIYERFEVARVLVIAPKKVAEDTWTGEQTKWDHLGDLSFSKVLGTPKQRLKALQTEADIYLINREMVTWLVNGFGVKRWPFDMVVVDELSSFKSSDSERFRALRKIIRSGKVTHFVGLTGTPQPRGLEDLWPQMYLVDQGERLGDTLTKYRDRWFNCTMRQIYRGSGRQPIQKADYTPKPEAEEQIHEAIKDVAISLSADDWLNVPEAIEIFHPIRLDSREQQAVKRFTRTKVFPASDGETITAGSAAQIAGKLLQIANGRLYDEDKQVHIIHDKKIEALKDLIEEANGASVMVFYWFQHDRQALIDSLQGYRITELKSSEDRAAWNRKEYDIAIVHPASMGHGLNLQDGGNIIVWYSMTFDLEIYQQANARLHRQGQKQKTLIHHLVTLDTYDEEAIRRLKEKDGSQKRLIESLKVERRKFEE